jgi:hypothetical protein
MKIEGGLIGREKGERRGIREYNKGVHTKKVHCMEVP